MERLIKTICQDIGEGVDHYVHLFRRDDERPHRIAEYLADQVAAARRVEIESGQTEATARRLHICGAGMVDPPP